MPKFYRRRKYSRKRKMGRWGIYKAAGSQMWKDIKWLKSVVNVERKYTDVSATTTASSTPTLVLLNGLSLGDTATTRDGVSVKANSSFLNVFFSINASATTTMVRVMLLLDTQPNATAATASEVLQSSGSVISPINITNGKRFKIMMDKKKSMSINGTEIVRFKEFRKLGFHTRYNTANNGTIADISTNAFYLLFMSDQATNTAAISYWHRMRFIDN